MSDIAIKVENVSKLYQLGSIGTGTMRKDLQRWWATIRGHEDPFTQIGQVNDRTKKAESEFVWALKDINFEVRKGEVLGIIGRNGAGKSTLLKILSKITSPTTGKIMVDGRIASLLEVGTGFHPELTGRENIFMNGAILGMRKWEIQKKLDAIIDFSGVEAYIDTPVKRYSSGMYVRLAFAVAAYLEPEILIVDEVLAVGDAEFQKKCLGRMKDVSTNEGRTVLFVSHNLSSVSSLCEKGLFLKNGIIKCHDQISETIQNYNLDRNLRHSKRIKIISKDKKAWISDFIFQTPSGNHNVEFNNDCEFKISIESLIEITNTYIGIAVNDINDFRIFTLYSKYSDVSYQIKRGCTEIKCKISSIFLKPGLYNIEIFLGTDHITYDYYSDGLQIEVKHSSNLKIKMPDSSQGNILIKQTWI